MASKRIDINKASIEELSSLSGVGRAKAEAIIENREVLGGFKSIKDLKNIPGIGKSIIDLNHGFLTCSKLARDDAQSESYCLRDRGEQSSSSGTNFPTCTDPYSLRERGDVPLQNKVNTRTSPLKLPGNGTASSQSCNTHTNNDKSILNRLECCDNQSDTDLTEDTCVKPSVGRKGARNSPASKEDSTASEKRGGRHADHFSEELLSSDSLNTNRYASQRHHRVCVDLERPALRRASFSSTEDVTDSDVPRCSNGGSGDAGGCSSHVDTGEGASQGMAASLRSRSAQPDKSVMKRKSEGGGSKDGSPEKKPCRTSSEGVKSEDKAVSSGRKSGDKSTHPFLRKGRIPSKANPPPELANWLKTFTGWSQAERLMALDELMEQCEPTQVRHVMQVIEPQFQRDFISLLPKELALHVLSFLGAMDLCRAAQTCQYWRVLAEDNLLWREKCQEECIDESFVVNNNPHHHHHTQQQTPPPSLPPHTDGNMSDSGDSGSESVVTAEVKGVKRGAAAANTVLDGVGSAKRSSTGGLKRSPWKAAFLRQQQIEYNWREAKIRPPKVLKGHDDHVITCLEFSGSKIVSGSDDNTLKVWCAITGKCLRTLNGHTGGVWSSQMRDNIVISGSTDRTLKVWNAESGVCEYTLYGHTSTVRCMCLYKNKVVSGSRDATLRLWDVETGECVHVLTGHVAAVRCVQYDGRRVVSGAYDYMVKIWDPDTETCLHTLAGHTNRVYSLQFDGTHIVSGSLDTSIRVWEVENGRCLHTLIGHQSLTSGMELKDNILVSGNADSTVKVWDIKTGLCLQTLQGVFKHQSAVTCLQFNKKFVITSSDDGTVKMWSLRTGCFLRNLVSLDSGGSGGVVWRIRASNTKLVCAVGSRNGTEETKLLVLDFDVLDSPAARASAAADGTVVDGNCSEEDVVGVVGVSGGAGGGSVSPPPPGSPSLPALPRLAAPLAPPAGHMQEDELEG